MRLSFHPAAREELLEAADHFERTQPGLGHDFAADVNEALARILEFPGAWSRVSRRTRRCLTCRFPYGIVYHVAGDSIVVVAVAHSHREPGYWRERLKETRSR